MISVMSIIVIPIHKLDAPPSFVVIRSTVIVELFTDSVLACESKRTLTRMKFFFNAFSTSRRLMIYASLIFRCPLGSRRKRRTCCRRFPGTVLCIYCSRRAGWIGAATGIRKRTHRMSVLAARFWTTTTVEPTGENLSHVN